MCVGARKPTLQTTNKEARRAAHYRRQHTVDQQPCTEGSSEPPGRKHSGTCSTVPGALPSKNTCNASKTATGLKSPSTKQHCCDFFFLILLSCVWANVQVFFRCFFRITMWILPITAATRKAFKRCHFAAPQRNILCAPWWSVWLFEWWLYSNAGATLIHGSWLMVRESTDLFPFLVAQDTRCAIFLFVRNVRGYQRVRACVCSAFYSTN